MVEIQYDEEYVLIGAIKSSYWELKEYVMLYYSELDTA